MKTKIQVFCERDNKKDFFCCVILSQKQRKPFSERRNPVSASVLTFSNLTFPAFSKSALCKTFSEAKSAKTAVPKKYIAHSRFLFAFPHCK